MALLLHPLGQIRVRRVREQPARRDNTRDGTWRYQCGRTRRPRSLGRFGLIANLQPYHSCLYCGETPSRIWIVDFRLSSSLGRRHVFRISTLSRLPCLVRKGIYHAAVTMECCIVRRYTSLLLPHQLLQPPTLLPLASVKFITRNGRTTPSYSLDRFRVFHRKTIQRPD